MFVGVVARRRAHVPIGAHDENTACLQKIRPTQRQAMCATFDDALIALCCHTCRHAILDDAVHGKATTF